MTDKKPKTYDRRVPLVKIIMHFEVESSVEECIELYNRMRKAFWDLKDAERKNESGKIEWTNSAVYRYGKD